jgi:hypothetical protein
MKNLSFIFHADPDPTIITTDGHRGHSGFVAGALETLFLHSCLDGFLLYSISLSTTHLHSYQVCVPGCLIVNLYIKR